MRTSDLSSTKSALGPEIGQWSRGLSAPLLKHPAPRPAGVAVPAHLPLMRCFRIADGLNTTMRRGEIVASMPVFGLRPVRCFFLRTINDPNDDNLTVSPFSKESVISFKTSSTMANDSDRDRSTF
jgi:hypothetical protein